MRNSVAKMKLAVLRQNGTGWTASVPTTPLSDINANRIVHPSIFNLLGRLTFSLLRRTVSRHDWQLREGTGGLLLSNPSAKG